MFIYDPGLIILQFWDIKYLRYGNLKSHYMISMRSRLTNVRIEFVHIKIQYRYILIKFYLKFKKKKQPGNLLKCSTYTVILGQNDGNSKFLVNSVGGFMGTVLG